jgi:hypothetical protein
MTPTEIFVYLEAKQPQQYYSGMTGEDVDELLSMRNEDFI